MAKRNIPKSEDGQLAELIIEKAQQQIGVLVGRNWPEINRIMEKGGGEIALSIKTQITDRKATPGEDASKDNRIKTTVSFAEKFSDSTETDLPDPAQPNLPGAGDPPID